MTPKPPLSAARPDWRDLALAALLAVLALALFAWRITDPARLDFDETHYVPAARALMAFAGQTNPEHPPLGKYLIGMGMALAGDNPLGWRIMSALSGAVLVFAGVMAARWLFESRAAAMMTGILLLFSQTLFVLARIAMLDIFMAMFLMLAFWMMTAAYRLAFSDRWRVILAGLAFGLSTACKWASIPLIGVAIIMMIVLYWRQDKSKKTYQISADGGARLSLSEVFGWLGPFAFLVYLATFLPYMALHKDAVPLDMILPHQLDMLRLQSAPMAPHPYQSRWWQWVLDLRPVWCFYEPVGGIQRGVLFIGNPAIMWGGLVALLLCLWTGVRDGARALLVPPLLWAGALAFFIVIPKPVQFYYHYFVPSLLLCFASAGVLNHYYWRRGNRIMPWLIIGFAGIVFLDFYPILSAAALSDPQDFNHWMWLNSWR